MMKKSILICILAIVVLAFSVTNVFALEGLMDVEPGNSSSDSQPPQQPSLGDKDGNQSGNQSTNNNVKKDTPVPDTGIEDAPIIAIGVCVVLSVLGYVQIKKNNV